MRAHAPSVPPGEFRWGLCLGITYTGNERGKASLWLSRQQRQPHRSRAHVGSTCAHGLFGRRHDDPAQGDKAQQTALLTPSLTSPPASMDVFTSSTALGTSCCGAGRSAFRPAGCSAKRRTVLLPSLWGAKDAAGNIIDVTCRDYRSGKPARIRASILGASALPVLFYDDATGISLAVFEDSLTQVTATLATGTARRSSLQRSMGRRKRSRAEDRSLQKSALGGSPLRCRAVSSDFSRVRLPSRPASVRGPTDRVS